MIKGVDISYANSLDYEDFVAIKDAGFEFVVIRLGFGTHTLDDNFFSHYNNAKAAGLRISIYHFSEALDTDTAIVEAQFVKRTLEENGIGCERIWLDMENSNWKKSQGFDYSMENVTAICKAFLDELAPLNTGVYASLSWLENYIDWKSLGCPVWNAEYNDEDDFKGAMWQYTDKEIINGKQFDANISYNGLI